MDDELRDEILEAVEDALDSVKEDLAEELTGLIEDKLDEALLDDISEEIADRLEERIDEAINDSISEFFAEGIEEYLEAHQFILNDGTVVQSRHRTRVLAPDKKKLLNCYGGLRVQSTEKNGGNETARGWGLAVQTRISCWEVISVYEREEDAIADLMKVENAITEGAELVEL
ncbi:MAG: hypothetical protein K6E62_02055 [Lachnospiraceae bacterium]|nr:hypothetical protein [Lachnospiraceae bacterium]